MQSLTVKTYEEMTEQVKLLLSNGYDVGIHKELDLLGNVSSYRVAY